MSKIKPVPFLIESIAVKYIPGKQRGVVATKLIKSGQLIEKSPIIVVPESQWPFASSTMLTDYFFETEEGNAALGLGYSSLYNHSEHPNADYTIAEDKILITALRDIKKNEEITIDYNWEPWTYYEKQIITKQQMEDLISQEEFEDE